MPTLIYVIISVVVAAVIGGVTNYLAIKMLFHPRQPLTFLGRPVPFTPGLIPKRKEEIAVSFGEVVGGYLITSDGLRSVLHDPDFRRQVYVKLETAIETLADQKERVEEVLFRLWGEEQVEAFKQKWNDIADKAVMRGIDWLWEERGWKEYKLAEVIPDWNEDERARLIGKATEKIVSMLQEELASLNADRLVRQMIGQWMTQSGGFFGTLAGIFMDEEKISRTLRHTAIERLQTPWARKEIHRLIERKVMEWEQMTLEQIAGFITQEPTKEWLHHQIKKIANYPSWPEWILQQSFQDLFSRERKEALLKWMPSIVDAGLNLVSANVEKIVTSLELPKLVRKQIEGFPVEQLERVVLSVSGREFRAITWLGALLGGMIGLMQALFYVWVML